MSYQHTKNLGELVVKFPPRFWEALAEGMQWAIMLQSIVLKIGQWLTGDEKLLHFTGNFGFIRVCLNKPWHWHLAL
jgi:hypothetical protein